MQHERRNVKQENRISKYNPKGVELFRKQPSYMIIRALPDVHFEYTYYTIHLAKITHYQPTFDENTHKLVIKYQGVGQKLGRRFNKKRVTSVCCVHFEYFDFDIDLIILLFKLFNCRNRLAILESYHKYKNYFVFCREEKSNCEYKLLPPVNPIYSKTNWQGN